MSVVEPGSDRAKMIARIKDILTQPSRTWEEIDGETTTVGELYAGYVAPLAGISALCGMIGLLLFGAGMFGFVYHPNIVDTLVRTVVSFLVTLAAVYLLALVIDLLAPRFGGASNRTQAFKVAAYSGTAGWVAGVAGLIPSIGGLVGLVGAIYGLYILYKGLPRLMKSPQEKTTPYFASIIGVMILVGLLIYGVVAWTQGLGGPFRVGRHTQEVSSVTIPGNATIDLSKIEQAENALKAAQSGKGPKAMDPEALKAFLPASLAGYGRTGMETGSGEMAGMQGSSAKATYAKGAARIEVSVTDIGAAGALASLAGSFKVKSSKQEGDHYEKVDNVNGRMTQEEYDQSTKAGKYSVMVGDKFMVEADGEGASMDELKAAVGAIDTPALEAAAKG